MLKPLSFGTCSCPAAPASLLQTRSLRLRIWNGSNILSGQSQQPAGSRRQDPKDKAPPGGTWRKFTLALQSMQRIFLHHFCLPFPEPQLRSRTNRGTERRERERFIHLNVFIFPGAKGRPSAAGLLPPGICWKKVWAKGSAGGYASRLGP